MRCGTGLNNALLTLILWVLLLDLPVLAQPSPPLQAQVYSYLTYNRIRWWHPSPSTGVTSYLIFRSTSPNATVSGAQIASVAATLGVTPQIYDDNTAVYAQEYYYTVVAVAGGLNSGPSEEVKRFLPRWGYGRIPQQVNHRRANHYLNWDPYPGQWNHCYLWFDTNPNVTAAVTPGRVVNNNQAVRTSRTDTLTNGTNYYVRLAMGRPDWVSNPNAVFYTSYSTSLPILINDNDSFADTASSTYFNNSLSYVGCFPSPSGGVRVQTFSGSGGGFWRFRRGLSVQERGITSRVNAPVRAVVSGITPSQPMAAGRSKTEVRVSDEFGNEVPCLVADETSSGGLVTSFTVHFLAEGIGNGETRYYWVYWGNPSATVPGYSWSQNADQTSQWDITPWYSRKVLKAGLDTYTTTAGNRVIASPPSPADDNNALFTLPWGASMFFDLSTSTWYLSANGYMSTASYSTGLNTWDDFIGNPAHGRGYIAPLWLNLMVNDTVPTNAGLYQNRQNAGTANDRVVFTWLANRFNAPTEIYAFQGVVYRYGDIAFRYENLNYNGLWQTPSGSGDNPVNVAPHHTVGISMGDNSRWLSATDAQGDKSVSGLSDGINRNMMQFFQSCHSWNISNLTDVTNISSIATHSVVAHYDSRVMDAKSSDPTWGSVQWDITGNGGTIDLYVRSTDAAFPAWSLTQKIATDAVAPGSALLALPAHQYLQYRAVFKKSAGGDDPVLNWIRFTVGYVTLASITETVGDVSQGQSFPATMTFYNDYSVPVTANVASLTFTPAAVIASFVQITPMPVNVPPGASASIGFMVTVASNSGNLNAWSYIDGYISVTDGVATLTDAAAAVQGNFRVQAMSNVVINQIDTTPTKVNKGQGGIVVRAQIQNTGYVPMTLDGASITLSLGNYAWNLVTPVLPVTLGNNVATWATFTVTVLPDSPSGLCYINGTASGTNQWTLATRDATSATIIDSWLVQSPASLTVGEIRAPALVYRGQTNIPVEVELMNLGEADGYVSSVPLRFSLGSYSAILAGETMPKLVSGGQSTWTTVLVSLMEDTPTGTAVIEGDVKGYDGTSFLPLNASGAAIPGEWTILGEKILTYKDPSHLYPSSSFTRPGTGTTLVFAKAENLAPMKEMAVRWVDPSGVEIATATTMGFADASGTLCAEFTIATTTEYGIYTAKITNMLNSFSPAQTNFAVVTSASVTGSISIPARVSVGQNFKIAMVLTNDGGASAVGMEPTVTLPKYGTGNANQIGNPAPLSLDVSGMSTGVATYTFIANLAGTFSVAGSARGFDGNSDAAIQVATSTSATCTIQTPASCTINFVTATPTLVFRNQQKIPVEMEIENLGEADARLDQMQLNLTPVFGTGNTAPASPSILPFVLPGLSKTTVVFFLNINAAAATGLATMTGRIRFYDENNSASPAITISPRGVDTWSIATATAICARDAGFANVQYSFNQGQTVYVQASGLPLNTPTLIRFFDALEPYPPVGPGVGILTPLNSGPTGIVSHQHLIPANTPNLNRWMAWVEDDLDGNPMTSGTMQTVQFFDVCMPATYAATLSIGSSTCFVGDQVAVTLKFDNLSTASTNIQVRTNTFNTTYAAGSVGSLTRQTAVTTTWYAVPTTASRSWTHTYLSVSDSGLTGSCTLQLPAGSLQVNEINTNVTTNYPVLNSTAPIIIYKKVIDLASSVVDCGVLEPGQTSATLTSSLSSTGNHWLPAVRLAPVDLRFTATATISAGNMALNPIVPFSIGTGPAAVPVSFSFAVPFNQAAGTYVATMAFYEDHNRNTAFETSDPNDLFMVKVVVPSVAKALVVQDTIDLGIVPPGATSASSTIEFVGVGNLDLTSLRFVGPAPFTFDPVVYGPMPGAGYGTAAVSVSVPLAAVPGVYIATGTLFDDLNLNGTLDGGEASDTFTLTYSVGTQAVSVVPDIYSYGYGTPTLTMPPQTLTVTNSGDIPLYSLRGLMTDFDNLLQPGMVGSDNAWVAPPLTLAAGTSLPGTSTVYVPGGTATGTYIATYSVFEDRNANLAADPGEVIDRGSATFSVQSFYKMHPILYTIDFGGMRPGTTLTTPVGLRNAGSLDIPWVRFETASMTNGTDWLDVAQLTMTPAVISGFPRAAIIYPTMTLSVPVTQPYGLYQGLLIAYGDIDNDGVRDADEPWCYMTLRVEIGDKQVTIVAPAVVNLVGDPATYTNTVSVSAKNTGYLTLTKVKAIGTDFTGPDVLASDVFLFSPSNNLGYLLLNQTKSFNVWCSLPWGQTDGVYTGTLWAWDDSNNDGVIQSAEASHSVPISLAVGLKKVLNTTPATLDLGIWTRGDVASSVFLAQNVGNVALMDARWLLAALDGGGPTIPVGNISITPAVPGAMAKPPVGLPVNVSSTCTVTIPAGTPDGLYTANMIFFEDEISPAANNYDVGEPFWAMNVRITVATPFVTAVPPTVNWSCDPGMQTSTQTITISNTGPMSLNGLRYSFTNLVSGGNTIASSAITFLPSVLPPLAPGASLVSSFSVQIASPTQAPGVYTGTFLVYEDRNNNNVFDATEANDTVALSLTVNALQKVDVAPVLVDFGKIARGTASSWLSFQLQNIGNVALNGLSWVEVPLLAASGSIPTASVSWVLPGMPIAPWAWATCSVKLETIAPDQELGVYFGSPFLLTNGTASDVIDLKVEIIPGGPQVHGAVRQFLATETFNAPPPGNRYLLSAYVCPGTGTAGIGMAAYKDNDQVLVSSYGVSINAAGVVSPLGTPVDVCVVESAEAQHPAFPGVPLRWFRVGVAFDYQHDDLVASHCWLLLYNMSAASQSVWFDGVQLERAVVPGQTRPTTYAPHKKIVSPGRSIDLPGRKHYYEW